LFFITSKKKKMNIAVLGTGMVGDTIGSKLVELGHKVMMGSRSAGNEKALAFVSKHAGKAVAGTMSDAAAFGEIVFNCTSGAGSMEALRMAGAGNLKGKILIDVSNPLDFSKGMPPSLFISNTSSLGEEIQKEFPDVRLVKAFNTMWCGLMVNPSMIHGGDHDLFVCGNDERAKSEVKKIIVSFGWSANNIIDLGDITAARGTEMYLPLWLRIMGTRNNGAFNIKIVG
jgi:8-hydroxy-5-deazaflavin:NADPH oxidoreductase